MRLTRLVIENFKGVGAPQVIELRPITLLFGPNSAGKSTILQALQYLREVIERDNPNPDQTLAGGLTDLGGYVRLVHRHERDRAIRIKARLDLEGERDHYHLPLNTGNNISDPQFRSVPIRYLAGENAELEERTIVREVGVGVEVKWNEELGMPYVAKLFVELDGEDLAELHAPSAERLDELTGINWDHPLLQEMTEHGADMEDAPDEESGNPFNSPLGREFYALSQQAVADDQTDRMTRLRVKAETENGVLSELDGPLTFEWVEFGDAPESDEHAGLDGIDREIDRRIGLDKLLDEMVFGPVRILRDYLRMLTYIGPIRQVPKRNYRPRLSPDRSRWAEGLAAWDALHNVASTDFLDHVNEWLSSERLKTGYRLRKVASKQIPETGAFTRLMSQREVDADDLDALQKEYASAETVTEIKLFEQDREVPFAPVDVGIGISQVIPIVVACLGRYGLILMEQPELHIHPATQVGLGDLFIEATKIREPADGFGLGILVETHSEHILLRLLRRVRERHDDELPSGISGLAPSDLSIIYVENDSSEAHFRALPIDEEGEFLNRWPHGFFEERDEELF